MARAPASLRTRTHGGAGSNARPDSCRAREPAPPGRRGSRGAAGPVRARRAATGHVDGSAPGPDRTPPRPAPRRPRGGRLGALPVLGLRELLRLLDLPNTLAHQYPDGRRQLQPPSLCLPSDGPPERGWEHDAHGTCPPGRAGRHGLPAHGTRRRYSEIYYLVRGPRNRLWNDQDRTCPRRGEDDPPSRGLEHCVQLRRDRGVVQFSNFAESLPSVGAAIVRRSPRVAVAQSAVVSGNTTPFSRGAWHGACVPVGARRRTSRAQRTVNHGA